MPMQWGGLSLLWKPAARDYTGQSGITEAHDHEDACIKPDQSKSTKHCLLPKETAKDTS